MVAAQAEARRKSIIWRVIVTALTVYIVGLGAPDIAFFWLPRYDFGVNIGNDPVSDIAPHSAAADAGIQIGDRIETQYESIHERLGIARPGQTVRLHILHSGHEKIVTLVARPVYARASDARMSLFWMATYWIRIALSVALVWLRPGWMTGMFFISTVAGSSITSGGPIFSDLYGWLSPLIYLFLSIPHDLLSFAAPFAFALFALLFPDDRLTSWGRRVLPFVLVGFGLSIALGLIWDVGGLFFGFDPPQLDQTRDAVSIAGQLLAIGAFLLCCLRSSVLERKRIGWVVAAFVIPTAYRAAVDISWLPHGWQSTWQIFDVLGIYPWQLFQVLAPFALAYAIVRHRLFDIEFVLSRTLVYALLIIAAMGIFVAIDFVFTSRFHGSRGELAVDIAVALGLGFWVRAIQGRAIDLVDRLLFRRRYDARVRLKATLDAMTTAESTRSIEEILTSGAASALGLASAVFFRRVADGGLLREVSVGWPPDALWHLLSDDPLVASLDKQEPSVDLQAIGWSRTGASPPQQPVLAIPVRSGSRVVGVTFYGSRENGAPPSPDEMRGLVDLARRAAGAYLLLDSERSGVTGRELAAARIAR